MEYPYNSLSYILYYKHNLALKTHVEEPPVWLDGGLGDETIIKEEIDEINYFETHQSYLKQQS